MCTSHRYLSALAWLLASAALQVCDAFTQMHFARRHVRCHQHDARYSLKIAKLRVPVSVALSSSESSDESTESSISKTVDRDGAPYSRKFPRYRLDLTRSVKPTSSPPWAGFANVLSSPQSRLASQFPTDKLVWLDRLEGVAAYARLWRLVHEYATGSANAANDTTQSLTDTNKSWLVGLPGAQPLLLVNWFESMQWLQETLPSDIAAAIQVEHGTDPVPWIRLSHKSDASIAATTAAANHNHLITIYVFYNLP
jgi:hypothetical protein